MDDRFFEAWITRDWRVCGLPLQPLCLGHLVNLAAVGSTLQLYLEEFEARVTVPDLLIAVRICAERWPFRGRLRPRVRDIAWRLLLERYPTLFRREAMRFAAYIADHTSAPEFWKDEFGGGRALSAPLALQKAAFLLSETALTEERVWSMPLGRVDYLIAAIEERRTGSLRFLYDDELEAPAPMEDVLEEDAIVAMARQQLPPDRFQEWLSARRAKGGG